MKKSAASSCENCANYYFDEYSQQYCCDMDLDEDEMQRFLTYRTRECPYYTNGDEYAIVRKQN